MLRFVLVDDDGDYYGGEGESNFGTLRAVYAKDLSCAVVFSAELSNGVIQAIPELPRQGRWQMRMVELSLRE